MLYNDDCLSTLLKIPSESVDLIYLDPPFFSQKTHSLANSDGNRYEFDDIWKTREEYLYFMKVRLQEMRRVLKSNGSIFIHCNHVAVHYLKILLDDVFSEANFRSEIIWCYKRWSNAQKGLIPNHQTILYYSKTNQFKYNTIYQNYSPTTNVDQILQDRVRSKDGRCEYKKDTSGDVVIGKEKKGVPLSDVWEIPFLNPKAKERVGYPTQKPVALLKRIIQMASNEGDLVLDPFCGSGTTLVAAKLLNRAYIGIDISSDAVNLAASRLEVLCESTSSLLSGGVDKYLTKDKIESAILNQLDCVVVQRNKGIDGILKNYVGGFPVPVKIQKNPLFVLDEIGALVNAAKKRKSVWCIYVARHVITDDVEKLIPNNVIVIYDYKAQLSQKIKLECVSKFELEM